MDPASLGIVVIFSLGLITGAATFSRVFSWLFSRYKNVTLAVLTGFLLGSLPKIWPWKNVELIYNKITQKFVTIQSLGELEGMDKEMYKIVSEILVLPGDYWGTPRLWMTLFTAICGFLLVFVFEYRKKV